MLLLKWELLFEGCKGRKYRLSYHLGQVKRSDHTGDLVTDGKTQPRASYLYQLPNSLEIILAAIAWMAAPGSLRELRKTSQPAAELKLKEKAAPLGSEGRAHAPLGAVTAAS